MIRSCGFDVQPSLGAHIGLALDNPVYAFSLQHFEIIVGIGEIGSNCGAEGALQACDGIGKVRVPSHRHSFL